MRRALVLFALLGGAGASWGQIEEQITVTATAVEEPARSVPTTVDVVDEAEILDRQAVQAIDLLRTIAGLDVVQSGARGKAASLFVRGTNSSHTLVLWNGVELNDPYFGAFDFSNLATDGVERLEVVRGPYSALYGSSALGGVVQLVSRRREAGDPVGRLRAEAGSDDFLRGGGAAGFLAGPLAIDLAGHLRRGEGEVDNDFYDGEELDLSAFVSPTESFRVGAMARALGSEIGVPFDFAGSPSPEREQELDALSLAGRGEWTAERAGLDFLVARTGSELAFRDPNDPFAASDSDAERDQARASGRFALGEAFQATVGGEWERQQVSSSDAFGSALSDERQEEWAAFGQLSFAPAASGVRVDLGLRRDDNDAFGAETSARLGAVWAIQPGIRLRAGYGEAFRAPSLADLYYPGFGNPALEPERAESWELGADGEAGSFSWSAVLFENNLDNLIEFDFVTSTPQNLGRARTRGLEIALGLRHGIFDARLAGTFQEAENLDDGAPLLRRPDEKASLVLVARPGAWTLGGVVRLVGDRVDFGDLPLDAYTAVDLTVERRLGERWRPFARIENLFDEQYEEVAGFPAPGTGFAVGVDVRF